MSYGLNIYKSDGTLGFSTLDITWMQIDQFEVAANGTVSNNYPIATGMTIITQIQIPMRIFYGVILQIHVNP